MSTLVDLTVPITDHFRWPVERKVQGNVNEGDLFQITWMGWTVHAFTHIDAPRHMVPNGATTSDLSLDQVTGRAAVVDLSAVKSNSPITPRQLQSAGSHITPDDIVLLKTCWDGVESIDTREFWTNAPFLTRESCEWLLARKIKAVGYDFPQDYPIRLLLDGIVAPIEEHVSHDVLLRNGVIMIEYLQNLASLRGLFTQLYALPLKIPDADGAPARVIAVES